MTTLLTNILTHSGGGCLNIMCSVATLLGTSMPRNIDPDEDLRYFSWAYFVLTSLIYSAFVFSGELSKDGPLIFSKQRNLRSIREVVAYHCTFLFALLCLVRIFNLLVPNLPYWMTDTFRARARFSIADIVFIALAAVMVHQERRLLFREREPDSPIAPE